jgi:hypothetical protein
MGRHFIPVDRLDRGGSARLGAGQGGDQVAFHGVVGLLLLLSFIVTLSGWREPPLIA